MIIKCIKNRIIDIQEYSDLYNFLTKSVNLNDNKLPLDIEKSYVVYGCVFKYNIAWFYICEDDYCEYPKLYAAPFFKIMNNDLSKYWVLGKHKYTNRDMINIQYSNLLIKEWANDYSFYERLVEGQDIESDIFYKYKNRIDNETKG